MPDRPAKRLRDVDNRRPQAPFPADTVIAVPGSRTVSQSAARTTASAAPVASAAPLASAASVTAWSVLATLSLCHMINDVCLLYTSDAADE